MSWEDTLKQRRVLGVPVDNVPRMKLGGDRPARRKLGETPTIKIEWEDVGRVEGVLKFNIQNSGQKTWAEIATSLRELNHIGVGREASAKRHPKANEVASGSLLIGKDLQ